MKETISFALAQINTTVGDISGNIDSFRKARNQAARDGIDVLLTSEPVSYTHLTLPTKA